MSRMKMVVKCSMFLLMVLGLATPVFARGAAAVSNTVHNLSATGPAFSFYLTDEQEVCIFCHTPHSGSLTGPLWNKADPAPVGGWQFYDSATLSTTVKNVAAFNNESLICLSCHDGSVSVNHLLNYGQTNPITTAATFQTDMEIWGTPGANTRIGGNQANVDDTGKLGDDHPISFSYDDVITEYTTASKPGLHDTATVLATPGADVRFFGATNRVECSTCHDPHVDYETDSTYAPFLNMSNAGSNLCLACHDK